MICCHRVLHQKCADAARLHNKSCAVCRATTEEFELPFTLDDHALLTIMKLVFAKSGTK